MELLWNTAVLDQVQPLAKFVELSDKWHSDNQLFS